MTPARPRPVTSPRRAHINWTAVINGNENSAVQSGAYPKAAPTTEYVEIPDGSSSAAPVIRPGPSAERYPRNERDRTVLLRSPGARDARRSPTSMEHEL